MAVNYELPLSDEVLILTMGALHTGQENTELLN